jgi:diguanylate cyclase (GGDEF)-like protein/PAS domain S-box-containing protein
MESMTDKKPLILLVDDVPTNLHVLAAMLQESYRLKMATSGVAALELAGGDVKPDLILLDVNMPGMSGIEVLRQLRQNAQTRNIPVIFVTADLSERNQLEGLELGADDYLTKPLVVPILRARVRNAIERQRAQAQLRLAAYVFEHSGEAMMITDHENCITAINPAFVRLTGYTVNDLLGKNPRVLGAGLNSIESTRAMWISIVENRIWQGERRNRNKNGDIQPLMLTVSAVHKPAGGIDFHIASYVDLSAQKAVEDRIRHVAQHDALTGLPNRLHLQASLGQEVINARREKSELAVMFIDLDHFKEVNDTFGHDVGDGLLVAVAQRLRSATRESDLVARLGGDEFVVVLRLKEGQAEEYSAQVANKILTSLSPPFTIEEHALHTTPSIGVALYPRDGEDMNTLMKCADIAMYQAKQSGRAQFRFYLTKTAPDHNEP